jgi:hypothetical protein
VPTKDLTADKIQQSLAPYSEALAHEGVKPGVFRMADNKTTSIDLNAVVDQAHRENSVNFAKANDQQAIFDLSKFENIDTGGKGETVLKTPEQIAAALPDLLAGKPVNVEGIAGQAQQPEHDVTDWGTFGPLVPDYYRAKGDEVKTLEDLKKEGYSSLDLWNNHSLHDPRFAPELRKDDTGRWPLSPEGIKQAITHAENLATRSFDFGRRSEGQAQPAKRKPAAAEDEFKFSGGTTGGFSRAWILPNGRPVQLGSMWHHEWLDKNPDIVDKYGLKNIEPFKGTDAEGPREEALRHGFVRVNYNANNGLLTVEARASDWPKQKASVQQIAESNIDNIDRMRVSLMNDNGTELVDSAIQSLFNYDTDKEKLEHLPFISEGAEEPRTGPVSRVSVPVTSEKSEAVFGGYGGEPVLVFDKAGAS